jgi:hypothetical protein
MARLPWPRASGGAEDLLMPVCVAGMHRSGTSLVARLLAASKVYGGPPADLVTPAPDNPEGFGENLRFLRLNDAVLARLGGFWDRPPAMPPGWVSSPRLSRLRQDAAQLVAGFQGHEPWFWKDPRNSLTVAFWRELLPDLQVVVCVRNPREVVASLERRGGIEDGAGWGLWVAYNRRVLAEAPPARLVVTHYEAYLHDAPAELRRVATALGLALSDATIARACAAVAPRTTDRPASPVVGAAEPAEVDVLYRELCGMAGPVCHRALTRPDAGPRAPAEPPGATPAPRPPHPVVSLINRARRVWRQEGPRALGQVVVLQGRRATARGWSALRRIRARRPTRPDA